MAWTRAQIVEHLQVTPATLKNWERYGAGRPTTPSKFQVWAPAEYEVEDVALLQVVAHASRVGMGGKQLTRLWESLMAVRRFLRPGWSGVVVVDSDWQTWLVGEGVPGPTSVDVILDTLPKDAYIRTVSHMRVPDE